MHLWFMIGKLDRKLKVPKNVFANPNPSDSWEQEEFFGLILATSSA